MILSTGAPGWLRCMAWIHLDQRGPQMSEVIPQPSWAWIQLSLLPIYQKYKNWLTEIEHSLPVLQVNELKHWKRTSGCTEVEGHKVEEISGWMGFGIGTHSIPGCLETHSHSVSQAVIWKTKHNKKATKAVHVMPKVLPIQGMTSNPADLLTQSK